MDLVDEVASPDAINGLLGTLVEYGHLDRDKAVTWSFIRTIDYKLTTDPRRCQRVASALALVAGQSRRAVSDQRWR